MRKMKDSGVEWIGEIPSYWNVYRNKNAFTCSKTIVGVNSVNTQLLSLTTKGVKQKDVNNAEGKLPATFDTYQYVRENDLVMCLFDLDCSAVFSGISSFDGMISPAYRVLTCTKLMDSKYADYWFQYIGHGRKFNHYAKNIRYTLSYEEFASLPMIFPSREEQHRIAEYLDAKCSSIDAIIAKQETIIEKLKEYKLSVITEGVTKGLNPGVEMKESGIGWFGNVPIHYEVRRLKFMCNKIADGTHFSPETTEDGYPYITAGDVCGKGIDYNSTKKISYGSYLKLVQQGCRPEKNDVLIVKDGATTGRVGLMMDNEECVILSSVAMMHPMEDVEAEYLMYIMMSQDMQSQITLSMAGSAMPRTTLTKLMNYYCVFAPKDEQVKIVEYLNNVTNVIDKRIEKLNRIVNHLIEYKKSLIYEVVTGKKEV